MPQVSGPYCLRLEALKQLAQGGLNAAPFLGQPPWPGMMFVFGRFVRGHQDHRLLAQFSAQARAPVIPGSQPRVGGASSGIDMEVVDMGRS